MQGARFESGLDNSPMYDGEFFEPNLKQDGSYKIGQMTLCRDLDTHPDLPTAIQPILSRGCAA